MSNIEEANSMSYLAFVHDEEATTIHGHVVSEESNNSIWLTRNTFRSPRFFATTTSLHE